MFDTTYSTYNELKASIDFWKKGKARKAYTSLKTMDKPKLEIHKVDSYGNMFTI